MKLLFSARIKLMLLTSILFLSCTTPPTTNPTNTLKIGIIASLTGPADEEGRSWVDGAQLAVDELKEQEIHVSLIIDDDETKPAKVASAFAKMATVDKVSAIIGGTWDFLAEAAYPLAKQYQIPFLTPTNPIEIISKPAQSNPYVFVAGLSLAAEREAIKLFLAKEQIRSITILESTIPWGTFHAEMLQSLAVELGIPIKARIPFSFDSYPDVLKSLALQISRDLPDLVFAPISYIGIDVLLGEFSRLRISPKLLTTQHLEDAFKLSDESTLYKNAYAVYPKLLDSTFSDRFFKRFNRPATVYSPHGYDSLMFLVKALRSNINLAESSSQFSYEGSTGTLALSATSRALGIGSARIMTTRNGIFEEWS